MQRVTRIFKSISGNTLPITVLFLIFLAIAFYGGEYAWQEAAILGAIFLVSGVTFVTGEADELRGLPFRLFLPLTLLSAYSFLQGLIPLVFAGPEQVGVLPYGFDPVISMWSSVKILGFVCLFGLCFVALGRGRSLFINGLIFIGGLFAMFGVARNLIQVLIPNVNRYFFAYELRADVGFGSFLNQNHFALLMLMTLGLSLAPIFAGKVLQIKKLAYLAAALLAWVALILTASRAGIIGSFFVAATLITINVGGSVLSHRRTDSPRSNLFVALTKWLVGSILILAALVAGVVLIGQERVLHRFAQLPAQLDGAAGLAFRRADVWEATINIIKEHFVYGVGLGGFQYAVSQYIDIAGDIVPRQAHNDYLEFVASMGIPGVALAIWFLWLLFVTSRSRSRNRGSKLSAANVGAICGIVGVAFHSLADFGLQYLGNMSFFIALVSVAISPVATEREKDQTEAPLSRTTFRNAAAMILGVMLCGICAVFGYSRYSLLAGSDHTQSQTTIRIPFDAEYYAVTADRLERNGDAASAAAALRSATQLRPHDYALWLRLATVEAVNGDRNASENAFRSAISLAPLYGEPHFRYGSFLLSNSRTVDAMNELVFAARRDRRFTEAVLEMIWGRTTYTPEYLRYLTTDGHPQTNANVMRFLLDKREYELIVDLSCKVEFSDMERDMLVRQLLERGSIHAAWRIQRRQCHDTAEPPSFIDGDFELSEVRKGPGFGWRIGAALKRSNVGFDRGDAASKDQSLKFMFDGDFQSAFLEQTIPVRKNTRYIITFSYKTRAIVSAGPPVVKILTRQAKDAISAAETELSVDTDRWERRTLSVETTDKTDAIEVVITRQQCADSKCPIFGELWVDDFQIVDASKPQR